MASDRPLLIRSPKRSTRRQVAQTPIRAANLPSTDRLILWAFTCTIFLNAGLLFAVQPMFSRMVLPSLGGSPAVWTTCMLFFQIVLLAGYAYAHFVPRWLGMHKQALVHLALLLLSLLTLPIAIHASWTPASHRYPVAALLVLLTLSLGIPFFLLASGSPLLQKWFAHTRHQSAANPYFLYAASNLGSMIALLSYPLLLEPRLRLAEQSALWTRGYLLLVLLTAACVILLRHSAASLQTYLPSAASAKLTATAVVAPAQRLKWIALAFVPSTLLLGVTTFLTTDIAAVPLLWVLPLALYLLTFVIAFARRPLVAQRPLIRIQPYLLLPLIINMSFGLDVWPTVLLPLHLAAFIVAAMICHGELARTRPPVQHLTEFYLWISIGGALGGVFNVIVAPLLFRTVAEYPIALVLAALLRPRANSETTASARALDIVLPALVGAFMFVIISLYPGSYRAAALLTTGCVAAVFVFSFQRRPLRFGLGLAALLLAGAFASRDTDTVAVERSFFGVHRVEFDSAGYHLLSHGSTLHGAQSIDPGRRLEPLMYYHRAGPVGQIFSELATAERRNVAIIGLGAGSMACYSRPGERWTYYEIDPTVERLARDPRYFSFLADCQPVDVVLGDARLTLAEAAAHTYDLIILDAFSSDAIPIHLMTREALALYLEKLAPGGAIAFHISNRYLDLQPVLARLAEDAGLSGRFRQHNVTVAQRNERQSASEWLVLTANPADLGGIAEDPRWKSLAKDAGVGLWTDDFSNILSIVKWWRNRSAGTEEESARSDRPNSDGPD